MMESTQKMYKCMRVKLFEREENQSIAFWALQMMLVELGMEWRARRDVADSIFITIDDQPEEAEAARIVQEKVTVDPSALAKKLEARAQQVHTQIRPHLGDVGKPIDATVLDFGCGDGQVGDRVFGSGADIQLYDCVDYRLESIRNLEGVIPFTTDWASIADKRYEVGFAIAVLHHCDDPEAELAKLASVAKRLVVVESVINKTTMPWAVQALVDWVYNRGLHPGANIPVPGKFKTVIDWKAIFRRLRLRLVCEQPLGIDLPLVPEHHVLFVLEHV